MNSYSWSLIVLSVAHFHLRNGASLWRINWLADSSQLGMNRSYGIMVNYKYHLPDIATNANDYIINGHLPLSSSVQQLLWIYTLGLVTPSLANVWYKTLPLSNVSGLLPKIILVVILMDWLLCTANHVARTNSHWQIIKLWWIGHELSNPPKFSTTIVLWYSYSTWLQCSGYMELSTK